MKIEKLLLFILVLLIGCDWNKISTNTNDENSSNMIEGCMDTLACNYNSIATIVNNNCIFEDACGICGGEALSNNSCVNLLNIIIDTQEDFFGFQFDITGVSIVSSFGGIAEEAGFAVQSSSQRVIGFSLSGAKIPIGAGILTTLEVTGNTKDACLDNIILSDGSQFALEYNLDENMCTTIIVPEQ